MPFGGWRQLLCPSHKADFARPMVRGFAPPLRDGFAPLTSGRLCRPPAVGCSAAPVGYFRNLTSVPDLAAQKTLAYHVSSNWIIYFFCRRTHTYIDNATKAPTRHGRFLYTQLYFRPKASKRFKNMFPMKIFISNLFTVTKKTLRNFLPTFFFSIFDPHFFLN